MLRDCPSSPSPSDGDQIIGVDIGGANLKFASAEGRTVAVDFAMWKHSKTLGSEVLNCLTQFQSKCSHLVVTMTGELADCFDSRTQGVNFICRELTSILPRVDISVYSVEGDWFSISEACESPWDVAASNWHALASWVGRSVANRGNTLLIDVGSTTVDIIPICDGRVATRAKTDRDRLQLGQLVYTGMERTPVAMIVQDLIVDGVQCPVMAERFADSLDAYLCLELVAERPNDCDSADGRPKTRPHAEARLARLVGEDRETLQPQTIRNLAEQVVSAQMQKIFNALKPYLSRDLQCIVFSGHGHPLIEILQKRIRTESDSELEFIPLREVWGDELARVGPAYALTQLWRSEIPRAENSSIECT